MKDTMPNTIAPVRRALGRALRSWLPLCCALLLAGCGSDTTPSSGSSVAGGGIGGTGRGTVTGFGSIYLNTTRHFQTTAKTRITVDGTPVSESALQATGLGLVVQVVVGQDVSPDFSSGTALAIEAEHRVKGPVTAAVTATTPLQVLGQSIIVTSGTVLEPSGLDPAALVEGDILSVSGYADGTGGVRATRLEFKPAGLPVWKLMGVVANLVGDTFTIGGQTVNFAGVTPQDCGNALQEGDLVEVKAGEDLTFLSGDPLATVTSVECIPPGLKVPEGATGKLEAELEGLVTDVTGLPGIFSLDGQPILITGTTVFEHGALEDIVLGATIEVEGQFNTSSGQITAQTIEFRENQVRIRGPLYLSDLSGLSLAVMGIPVQATILTQDPDGVLSASADRQIEVRGFLDGSGVVFATELVDRGTPPDPGNVRLSGPVTGIASPLFTILGVVDVDAASAGSLRGDDDAVLNLTQFFGALTLNSGVDVRDGAYDGAGLIQNAQSIELDD